jgi:probable rRNA maturation factor
MDIQVNYEYRGDEVAALLDVEGLARFVIEHEGKPASTAVSINFVTDEAIHELNREWRGVDRPTDVLSFECDGVDDDFDAEGFDDGEFELGDIVIAVDVAERQAPEYGMSFAHEMSLLIVHGLLHLCGYDHVTDEDAAIMEPLEDDLLAQWEAARA